MTHRLVCLAALIACTFGGSAGAASPNEDYRAGRDRTQAMYRNSLAHCKALQGNARDVCRVEARGNYDVAKAELEAQAKHSPRRQDQVRRAKAKAAYKLAVEKCGDLSGNARDVCRKDAKTALVAAEGETRLDRADVAKGLNSRAAISERKETREDNRDAQLSAARERCGALSGDAKSACVDDAKKRFGKP